MKIRARRNIEGPIHKAILNYLRLALPPKAAKTLHHSPNELNLAGDRVAKAIAQGKAKSMGMRTGWPDIQFIHEGEFYALEVKSPEGKQGKQQKETQADIEAAGGRYIIARSVEDARAALELWGLV